jgi:dolichol-phosphate mannosyltransferase
LRLFYVLGLLCSLPFLTYLVYSFWLHIWHGSELVPGWTSLLLSIISFGTLNLVSLGIMGEYIGRIYEEGKHRPLFIVAESVGDDKAKRTGE